MTNPEQESFDLDEDLFAFDEVARELSAENERDESLEEIFASYREEDVRPPRAADEIAGASAAAELLEDEPADFPAEADEEPEPAAAPSAHQRPPARVAPVRPAPAAAARASARRRAAPDAEPEPEPETVAPAPRFASRLPKGMVAIAISVTVLNGLLGVVLLRNARTRDEVRGNETSAAVDIAQSDHPLASPASEPGALFDAEAHPTFVEARDEIARGEYAAARQRIYALLAIIDRLEDPRREAVEAEAQFVLAQTLHLEALERMGTSR